MGSLNGMCGGELSQIKFWKYTNYRGDDLAAFRASEHLTADLSENLFSIFESKAQQMRPCFTPSEIARIRRFGTPRRYLTGETLLQTGFSAERLFLVVSGPIRIMRRDELGERHFEGILQPGQFLAEIGQLSGQPALVDVDALDDADTILLLPEQLCHLIVAEAELGERIMRALILRRMRLMKSSSGPIIVGHSDDPILVALQGFLMRNGYPYAILDTLEDPEAVKLLERMTRSRADFPLVICPCGTVMRAPNPNMLATRLGWRPEF
ncbi:cyclic nucleotide-binding domain-containing protein [Burkholderia sp. BCC1047]|uniref:cyclic nucleotide-binding domain-containing protein n=1 Tax=Burkholderia sp. BCC1047 TaxID=2676299 RepID=UPI00158A8B8B|nr:cyclic nucleotide-binding domain-containing protein [Burkholderia sp. BCC1047]